MENVARFLEESGAVPLDMNTVTSFDRDALPFFTSDVLSDPFVDVSFRWNISIARDTFAKHGAHREDATFTGFILWCAIQALSSVREANFRFWNGHWYELKNPAFFMPIATGQNDFRLASTIMHNVAGASFDDFTRQYADLVARAKAGEKFKLVHTEIFSLAHNLVNLPTIRFTNIKPHALNEKNTHVWWIFGQRHEEAGKLYVPMTIRMHHANGDPVILDQILAAFDRHCAATICP